MRLKTSENVILYWEDGRLICDDFVAHSRRALARAAEPLLRWFSQWKDLESLSEIGLDDETRGRAEALARQLCEAGILVSEGSEAHRREASLGRWRPWGRSAAYFHFSSRNLESTGFADAGGDARRLAEKAKSSPQPPIFKDYPESPRFPLPKPAPHPRPGSTGDGSGFLDVLLRRRTIRELNREASITAEQLSTLLYYACGATHTVEATGRGQVLLKTSPSGGARHAIEVYPCLSGVEGLPPGIYHYSVRRHDLELVDGRNPRDLLPAMCGDQEYAGKASAVLLYSAVLEREAWKYETARAYRVLMMDMGHLSQTVYLVAAWLGLGAFFTGALRDETVEKELGLDGTQEIPLGASGMGVRDPGADALEQTASRTGIALGGDPNGSLPEGETRSGPRVGVS